MGFLGGKRYERERVLCVRSRIRVFSLSVLFFPFRTSEKELAPRGETLSSASAGRTEILADFPANTKKVARRRNLTFLFFRKKKKGEGAFAPFPLDNFPAR